MRSYPSYRASGIDWLGDIPEHWEAIQVRNRFSIVNGGTPSSGNESFWDGDVPWITPDDLGHIQSKTVGRGRRCITEAGLHSSSARLCQPGSIVVSSRAPIGHLAIMAISAATNQGCRTLVPGSSINSDYAYFAFTTSREVLQSLGKGSTFMELALSDLGSHRIPLPPLAEQQAIAAFLDSKTGQIDELVEKKRELIERLDEYRAALITRTVTRGLPPDAARAAGLDPSPPLKPSGIDWLGDIPHHWEVTQVKHRYGIQLGKMLQPEPSSSHDRETPYLKALHVQWGNVATVDPPLMWASTDEVKKFGVRDGDLLVCEGGEGGRAAIVNEVPRGMIIQNALHRVRPIDNSDNGFLMYWLTAFASSGWLESTTNKATIAHFTKEQFEALPICLPPPTEQQAIAAFLDAETERIDTLKSRVETAIERLQEYRTALVTAAVTGQIDVRGYDSAEMELVGV